MKNKIILDSGALLEYFKLLIESKSIKLTINKERKLNLFLELFKERQLYIVPQVLVELYSLLKRDAKDSNSKLKHWLEMLEFPHIKRLTETYISKKEILKERKFLDFGFTDIALLKALNKENFLLTTDFKLINLCKDKGLEAHHILEIII